MAEPATEGVIAKESEPEEAPKVTVDPGIKDNALRELSNALDVFDIPRVEALSFLSEMSETLQQAMAPELTAEDVAAVEPYSELFKDMGSLSSDIKGVDVGKLPPSVKKKATMLAEKSLDNPGTYKHKY